MVWVHPSKEGRELIKWAKERGWTDVPPKGRGYVKLLCPCGDHQTWIHTTPSGRNYFNNKRRELARVCPPAD